MYEYAMGMVSVRPQRMVDFRTGVVSDMRPGGVVIVDSIEDWRPLHPLRLRPPVECKSCGAQVRSTEAACSYCRTERP